jgi:hypothetical protein
MVWVGFGQLLTLHLGQAIVDESGQGNPAFIPGIRNNRANPVGENDHKKQKRAAGQHIIRRRINPKLRRIDRHCGAEAEQYQHRYHDFPHRCSLSIFTLRAYDLYGAAKNRYGRVHRVLSVERLCDPGRPLRAGCWIEEVPCTWLRGSRSRPA